jgi:hypothetical protein
LRADRGDGGEQGEQSERKYAGQRHDGR